MRLIKSLSFQIFHTDRKIGGIIMSEVFRVNKSGNYTVMSNFHMSDCKLSWKAKGLLSTMLSLPPNWDFTLKGLATLCSDGIDSTRTGIVELEKYGYVFRRQTRNAKGQMSGNEYFVYEQPNDNPNYTDKGNTSQPEKDFRPTGKKKKTAYSTVNKQFEPSSENPTTVKEEEKSPLWENPITENPMSENPTQLNTNKLNTYKLNTYISSNQSIFTNKVDIRTDLMNEKIDMIDFKGEKEKIYIQINAKKIQDERKPQVEELVDLIAWTNLTKCKSVKINGLNFDIAIVRDQFSRLTQNHIEYVIDCLNENKTKIRNRRNYLMTCLFNSLTSMQAENYSHKNSKNQKKSSFDFDKIDDFALNFSLYDD